MILISYYIYIYIEELLLAGYLNLYIIELIINPRLIEDSKFTS